MPFSSPANCIMLQLDTCCTASFVFSDIAAMHVQGQGHEYTANGGDRQWYKVARH